VSTEQPLKVSFGGYTSAGIKEHNEDAFAAFQPKEQVRYLKGVAACVADGVSCSANAQQASQTAVTQFIDDYYSTPDTWLVRTAASRIISSLNLWLFHHGQQASARHNSLVTTFSSLVIKSTTAHIFHVGDSRVYRIRSGRIECLTRDHLQKAPERSFLTRALGMDSHIEVDYKQENVEIGDVFLLTSDGAHEYVNPSELRQAVENGEDLEVTATAIVNHALSSGSDDNITCLLVKVDNLPLASIDEMHRQLTALKIPPVMTPSMTIDGYEIIRVLHSGTRSHLYLVKHPDHSKPYVLKAPSENFSEDAQYLDGFIREQWIGSRVNHNNVMKIFPAPNNSRFLYLLCEYIEGQTLRQWMHDHPLPSLENVRDIIQEVASGIRAMQRLGMVHRDLKPENIMLADDGTIKIIDFGTVKVNGLDEITSALGETVPVGSVNYIAPEYLLNQQGVHSSDIFSIAVIAYEMLTGKLPFDMGHIHRRQPKGVHEWRYTVASKYRKDIPRWVDCALQKATEADVKQRYEALSELTTDLRKPNQELMRSYKLAPLIERSPERFWQLVAIALAGVIVIQWLLMTTMS